LVFLISLLSTETEPIYFQASRSMQAELLVFAENFQGTLQQLPSPPHFKTDHE
jgi:hypothetical protein